LLLLLYTTQLSWINCWSQALDFAVRFRNFLLSLRLRNDNLIWQRLLWSSLAAGIPVQHDFNFDAENALSQLDVLDSSLYIVVGRVARVNHQAVDELHGLGALASQLARDDNLAALGSRFHDKTKHGVAGSADWKTTKKLVFERLGLSDSAQTASSNLLSVQLDCVVLKVEALLHDRGELANASALLAEHLLSLCGEDDDLGAGWSHAHLDATVAILGELLGKELVELGLEDTAIDKFSLF